MVQFICCQCSLRTSVMVVACVSLVHFIIESMLIFALGSEHRLVVSQETPFFYSMLTLQIFMALLSILLFVGAYVEIFWFCFPWLILTMLNILYHVYIVIVLIVKMIIKFEATKFELFMLVTFFVVALLYMSWIVFTYVLKLLDNNNKNNKGKSGGFKSDEEKMETRPLMDDN